MFNNYRREVELNVVEDLIQGRVFEHWLNFLVSDKLRECELDYKDYFKKTLIYQNLMNVLVEDISMQCPVMETFDPRQDLSEKDIDYLKKELEHLDWVSTSIDIVKDLETKGDVFFQIYYDEKDGKHKFNKLESENMLDIIDNGKDPVKYIYRNERMVKSLDLDIVTYFRKKTEDLIIFTEGYYVIYRDTINLDLSSTEDKEIVLNSKEMGDMVPIIHLRGKKKRKYSEFSEIPCVSYIDSVLYTTTINTDIRTSNRSSGSPRMVVVNGELDFERSVLDAGGIIHIDTPEKLKEFSNTYLPETNVKYFEITNSLSSLRQEFISHLDYLYRVIGLIPPTLQEKMSTSDSSKAIAQFRTKQETKNKYYLNTIRKGFSKFFGLLLRDNNKKSKFKEVYLEIPEILVTSSVYDNLLLTAQKMSLGVNTLKDYLKEQGYSEKQIEDLMENQKEVMENLQIDVDTSEIEGTKVNEVESTGVDNRFKQNKSK